jgi:hypothetical protein
MAGVAPPEDVGVGDGVGSPEGAGFSDEAGGADLPPSRGGGGLDDPPGDSEPTLGLGEALGARFGPCGLAGCEDGVAEDGTTSGAGGEVATFNAPLELAAAGDAAAGDAVGGVGPLVHGGVELVVDDVVWALAGLPELTPL